MDIEYFIGKISEDIYTIDKLIEGRLDQEYKVQKTVGWHCNCMSGTIRHYCKHSIWIARVIHNQLEELPRNVKLKEEFTKTSEKQMVGFFLGKTERKRK
jgi:hypothetical protein